MIEQIITKLDLEINETKTQYRFNCIYCNDTKKRGNLYKENLNYHCYRCNIHKNLLQLFNDNNLELNQNEYTYVSNIINSTSLLVLDNNILNSLYEKGVDKKLFFEKYNLIDADKDNRSLRFLNNNHLNNKKDIFAYDDFNKHIYLLNKKNNIIIGYLILNLRNFGKPEKITGLFDIYNEMNIDKSITKNEDILSKIINILNIDLDKNINIFDDVINSLFLDNSIYLTSNKHLFNKYNKQFIYANNNHGLLMYNERLQENEKVFNWKTFLNENNIKNKIYDLHDLVKYQNKSKQFFDLNKYFIHE